LPEKYPVSIHPLSVHPLLYKQTRRRVLLPQCSSYMSKAIPMEGALSAPFESRMDSPEKCPPVQAGKAGLTAI
jgi:hypothetical protein